MTVRSERDLLDALSNEVESALFMLAALDLARKGEFPQPPDELVADGSFEPIDNAELADEEIAALGDILDLMRHRLDHARGEPCHASDTECPVVEDSRYWVGRLAWHQAEPGASRN